MPNTTTSRQELLEKVKQFLPSKQDEDIAEILKKPESNAKSTILGEIVAQFINILMKLEAMLHQPEPKPKPQPKTQHSHLFDQLEEYNLGVVALDHKLDQALKSISDDDTVDKSLNENLVKLKELTEELKNLVERLKLIEQAKTNIKEDLQTDFKKFEESYKDACKERPELTRKEFLKENAPELSDEQIKEFIDEIKSQQDNKNVAGEEPTPTHPEHTPTPKPTPEQEQTETQNKKPEIVTTSASTGDIEATPPAQTTVGRGGATPRTPVPSGGAQPFSGVVQTTVAPTEARIHLEKGRHVQQTTSTDNAGYKPENKPEANLFARLVRNISMLDRVIKAMERTVTSIDITKTTLNAIRENPNQPVPTRTPTPVEQPTPEKQPRNTYTPRPAHK